MSTATPANLGFLTIAQEASGYLGGYLVTNPWGRPLEFRLSSAVQPNRVHQILYGKSLEPFLCSDLIGKTLIEKASTPVQTVIVDHPAALDLRNSLAAPVGFFQPVLRMEGGKIEAGLPVTETLQCHAQYPDDVAALTEMLSRLGNFDLGEPFGRIREALAEARKLGVGQRAAA